MRDFNLVVTMAADGHYHQLQRELAAHGEFHPTEFYGVLLGHVADPQAFLATLQRERAQQPGAFHDLGRVIPLDLCLTFTLETFAERLREALAPYAARLAGRTFHVRLERRGLKGRIISPEAERSLDGFLLGLVEQAGGAARIDFADPDVVLAVETIGGRCGIGLLTRELRERYPFVRTP